jgi:hypothetical protein
MDGLAAISGPPVANDARTGSVAARDQSPALGQFPDGVLEGGAELAYDESGGPADAAHDGVLGQAEGDAVRVAFGDGDGGLVDELAADPMEDAVGPELLADADFGVRAEGSARTLAGLDLLDEDLDLPALGVEGCQLVGRGDLGIEEVGEQAVDVVGAGEGVFDDA